MTTPTVAVSAGTAMTLTVAAHREIVVFSLAGALWSVPMTGGRAVQIVDPIFDAWHPQAAPFGTDVVFQAFRDGYWHLWMVDYRGGTPVQLTSGRVDDREPAFSPDGQKIVFASDRDQRYRLYTLDLRDRRIRPLSDSSSLDEGQCASPRYAPNGTIAYTVDDKRIESIAPDGSVAVLHQTQRDGDRVFCPAFSPSGELVYVAAGGCTDQLISTADQVDLMVGTDQLTSREDVFRATPTWLNHRIAYVADGQLCLRDLRTGTRSEIEFTTELPAPQPAYPRRVRPLTDAGERPVRGFLAPQVAPDGGHLTVRALNGLWYGAPGTPLRRIAGGDGYLRSAPHFLPTGDALVYDCDRAGTPDLWQLDLGTGTETRLTALPGAQRNPVPGPDGRLIAYYDEVDALWILDQTDETVRQILPALEQPGAVSWNPAGTVLVLAALRPSSARAPQGSHALATVRVSTGETQYYNPEPLSSLSSRTSSGPIWSPDGEQLAFVSKGLLWTMPVDPETGAQQGGPVQVTTETADSPCWLPDGSGLYYLSGGRLRQLKLADNAVTTVPLRMSWRAADPPERRIVRAGAVWDGLGDHLRHGMDIVIERGRVVSVEPSHTVRGTIDLDASELTVIPGLFEMHGHLTDPIGAWASRFSRLLLAYGITSVRSPGGSVYRDLEHHEAVSAGERVGPRLFFSGDILDGARTYSDCRVVPDGETLQRELERLTDLGVDFIKTYVRMRPEHHRSAIAYAHARGLPLTSHFLHPNVGFGQDGVEHLWSPDRLGHPSKTSLLGRIYDDAISLLAATGAALCPTLFNTRALAEVLGPGDELDDPRMVALMPPWQEEMFRARLGPEHSSSASQAALGAAVASLTRLMRSGGPVLSGTDAPLDLPGLSLHLNLRGLVRHGFTPREALSTVTSAAATWLGVVGQLGAVVPGAVADLAIVAGDPLADIQAAAATHYVVTNGEIRSTTDLLEPFRQGAPHPEPVLRPRRLPAVGAVTAPDPNHWWHHPGQEVPEP